MRVASYVKLSKLDDRSLSSQARAIRSFVKEKHWQLVAEVKEIATPSSGDTKRQELINAAVAGEIDVVVVWKLDRWGKSLVDLLATIKLLADAKVGFVSITESIDISTPENNPITTVLMNLVEFEHSLRSVIIKKGIVESRRKGRPHGRPVTVGTKSAQIKKLFKSGVSKSEIARRLEIGRTSVRRLLEE